MGLIFIKSQKQMHLNDVLAYCQSINEDAIIDGDYCVFEVNGEQRIQIKLTLETFQEDLQDLLVLC